MLCILHGDANVINAREMTFKVMTGLGEKRRSKNAERPSERSHEQEAMKGMGDKKE
jgi:hypothetical protein